MWWSGSVLTVTALCAGALGFAIGRWWSVPPVVGAWLLYVRVIYPTNHPSTVRLEPGLQRLVENVSDAIVWLTAGLMGAACMIGIVARWGLRESRRRQHTRRAALR